MGKSPGKWIKTVLFGKKASRSNSSKGRDVSRSANEKEAQVAADAPAAEFSSSLSMSQPVSITNDQCAGNSEFEQGLSSNAPCNVAVLVPLSQDADEQGSILSEAPNNPDRIRREEAATKAQAAFRGYLARRAFWALKGIIRLQALVRGHLVRRQAIATLRCIRGIVKLQALVRGQKIRLRDSGVKGLRKCYLGKFQIIASSSSAMPLCLEYGPGEPNSAWSWLERWTSSRIWEPSPETRKAVESKSQEKQENFQRLEIETGRSKRSVRRVPAANLDNVSTSSIPEFEKPKRSVRKVWSNPVDSMQEPQNELEKVKRNLRKVVSNSGMETTDQVEVRTEKPHHNLTEASGSSAPDVPDQAIGKPAEQAKTDSLSTPASKHLDIESTPKSIAQEEVVHVLHDDQSVVGVSTLKSSEKDDIMHEVDEVSKENQTSNVNQKTSRRKVSPPVKQQEYPENGVQHTPKLPSYMAATESAKAKLRGQGSPRSGPVAEQNDLTRRHSLPSPANCKLNAFSPRTQRIVQNGGKGGVKNDKSVPSSRDGNEQESVHHALAGCEKAREVWEYHDSCPNGGNGSAFRSRTRTKN